MENLAIYFMPTLLVFLGGGFTFGAFQELQKRKYLKTVGKTCTGTVFKLEKRGKTYHPVIRFVTDKQEWITQTLEFGSSPPAYQEGEEVTVMYDPEKPENMMLNDSKFSFLTGVFLLIGIILLSFGIYKFLEALEIL